MLDFKRLLKKHLLNSKRNRNYLTIFNEKRHNFLYQLTNKRRKLNGKETLILLYLQGENRMNIYNNNDSMFLNFPYDYNLHYENSIYEILQFTITNESTFIQVIITIYNIFSPNFCEQEEINIIECQGYSFKIFGKENGKEIDLDSGIFFPIEKKSKVKFSSNHEKYQLELKDTHQNEIIIFRNSFYFLLKFQDKVIFFSKNDPIKVKHKNNFLSSKGYCIKSKTFDNIYDVIFYHKWYYHKNDIICRMFNNIRNSIKKPVIKKEININLIINDIYKTISIKRENFVHETIYDDNIKIEIIDPFNLIFYINDKVCNVLFDKKYTYNFLYYNEIYIHPFKLGNKLGYGWIKYKNFINHEDLVDKKLKYLYTPLERPPNYFFNLQKLPFYCIVPSLFLLFFCILTILTFLVSIFVLFSCRTKT